MPRRLEHVNRQLTAAERGRHARMRAAITKRLPPKERPVATRRHGIASQIREARLAQIGRAHV